MDSLEGDIGIPSFTSPVGPSRRSTSRPASLKPATADLTRRLSFPDAQLHGDTLEQLRRWIVGFVLVDFDVDTGPNLDNNYPHFELPPSIRHQLAFSSLPEGDLPPSLTEHGYAYNWRINYPPETELKQLDLHEPDERKRLLRLPRPPTRDDENDGALYGYVWFNQEQNSALKRNYSQRSLVLLTHHPHLPGLFSSVLAILGPLHFLHAKQSGAKGGMVESACLNIAAWPEPTPGATLELPLLGSVLNVSLPLPHQAQYPALPLPLSIPSASPLNVPPPLSILTSTTLPPPILPATHPLTPLSLLLFSPQSESPSRTTTTAGGSSLSVSNQVGFTKLLLIWELLVLGEPLLLYTNDPRTGSELVSHFKNLVRPISLGVARSGESNTTVNPYFHIHDPSFPLLCKPGAKPPRGLLVASTNPLVLKNCQKSWPHILRLDRTRSPSPSSTLSPRSPTSSPAISPLIGRTKGLMLQDEDRRATRRSTTSSRSSSLASTSRRTFDAPASNYSASVAGSSLYSSRSSSPVAELRPQPQPATAVAGSKNGVSENGNGGGGWWGLKSERKRHIKKDEPVWKLVEQKWRAGDYVGCDEVLYRHFASLTEKLLSPISRYLVTTNPSSPPTLNAFLASLKTHGSPLALRSTNSFTVSFSQPGSTAVERFYAKVWDTDAVAGWRERWERERRKALDANATR